VLTIDNTGTTNVVGNVVTVAGAAGANGTVTVGSAFDVGDQVTVTIAGQAVTATVVAGQTSANAVAATLNTAINAQLAAIQTADASIGTVTVANNVITIQNVGVTNTAPVAVAAAAGADATLTFAATAYNVGDVITVTVAGVSVSYTVAAGSTSADAVASQIANAINSEPLIAAADADVGIATAAAGVVTIVNNDGVAGAFTLTSAITDIDGAFTAVTTSVNDVIDGAFTLTAGVVDEFDLATELAEFVDEHGPAIEAASGGTLTVNGTDTGLVLTGDADGTALTARAAFGTVLDTATSTTVGGSVALVETAATGLPSVQADPAVVNVQAAMEELGGDDDVNGGAGNDTLDGMIGDDTIAGGAGNDTIIGGAGADALTGDAGHDVFVYDNVADSSGDNVDTISAFAGGTLADKGTVGTADDYTSGDVIDLTAIATALGFTGGVQFLGTFADDTVADTFLQTGSANLQVVYVTGDGALYIDVDASGDINDGDMVIELTGVTDTLTQANFNPTTLPPAP
jgi:hypothetical protein